MSKTLTSRQSELSGKRSIRTIPLVVITIYSDRESGTVSQTLYYSDRTFYYDYGNTGTDRQFQAALSSIQPLSDEMPHLANREDSASSIYRTCTFELYNVPIDGTPLYETLRSLNIEGATVDVAELLLYEDDDDHVSSLTGDEHVVFFRGEVKQISDVNVTITVRCASVRPQVLDPLIASDVATVDPLDLGKRVPYIYGEVKKAPVIGWQVGYATTLGTELNDGSSSTGYTVTDIAGFPTSGDFDVMINGEELITSMNSVSQKRLTSVDFQRGQNGTKKTAHKVGETVVELIASTKFLVAAHECESVDVVYVRNPYNQQLVRICGAANDTLPTSIIDTADTSLVSGRTVTSITLTRAQLDTLMQAMSAQAAVTQQPVIDHTATTTKAGDRPTSSTNSEYRDGNPSTFASMSKGSLKSATFDAPSGAVASQTVYFTVGNFSGTGVHHLDFRVRQVGGSLVLVGQADEGDSGTFSFYTSTLLGNEVRCDLSGGSVSDTASARLYEIWRDVEYELPDPSLTTGVGIEGASVGFGLRFYVDAKGVKAPDATYKAASGSLLSHPADIMRHIVQERAGLTVDNTAWDEQDGASSVSLVMSCVDTDLGDSFEEMLSALAFESRSHLVSGESSSSTIYKRLAANNPTSGDYSYTLPSGAPVITDYQEGTEIGRDVDTIFTRWRALYDIDRFVEQNSGVAEDPWLALLQANPTTSDLTGVTTTEITNWEAQFGRRDQSLITFPTLVDADTAKNILAFYATESARAAATAIFRGVPWVGAYAIELGDIIEAKLDWWSTNKKVEVIGVTKRWADGFVDLVVVEVN